MIQSKMLNHALWYIISSMYEIVTYLYKQRAMIKMGNTYCERVPSHFAHKTIEKLFPNLLGKLLGSVGMVNGAN